MNPTTPLLCPPVLRLRLAASAALRADDKTNKALVVKGFVQRTEEDSASVFS
ncbi:MAG: hypothetical protein ACPIOQ_35095 [Promethearchaeia archaeon]